MKPLQVILLLVGGAAFAGILLVVSDRHATSAAAAPDANTNTGDAALVYHDQPAPVPAAPVETQVTREAARRPANDSTLPEVSPPSPAPGMPRQRPMPMRPRLSAQAQPMSPQLPSTPIAPPTANVQPTLRRHGIGDQFAAARERMVAEQLAGRGMANVAVLDAMRQVPRHQFVYSEWLTNAYVDLTLIFPRAVVLETPYVIAFTAEQLAAQPSDRVLDVEPGTAYDAAVFSLLVKEVYVTESLPVLADGARSNLERLGYTNNLFVRLAGMEQGWPEAAPFDTIVFNRPLAQFSESLLGQLKAGGRIIIPVSDDGRLNVLRKSGARLVLQTTLPVRPPPIPGNQVEMHVLPMQIRPPP